jgi:hypothetical protein
LIKAWALVVVFLAPLSSLGRIAKLAPVTGRAKQKRSAGIVNSCRGQLLALGRMLEAIKR